MNFFKKQRLKIFIGIILFFISYQSASALTEEFFVTGGYDMTGDAQDVFTVGTENTHDTQKLRINDNNRIQSNGESWPIGTSYNEQKYIEFQFSPNIPSNAVIENVALYHDFRRSSVLSEAKLKVINGNGIPQDFPVVMMPSTSNADAGEVFNITQAVNTPQKINGMKVWFLAYRPVGGGGNTKTSHDMLRMEITYSLSENPVPEEEPDTDPEENEEEPVPEEPEEEEETPTNPSQNLAPVTTDYVAYLSDGVPLRIELPFVDDHNVFAGMSLPDTPARGVVNVIEANRVAYVPTGTPGPDSFRFRVSDGVQYSNFSTVYIRENRQSIASLRVSFENGILRVEGLDGNNQLVQSDTTTQITITINRNGVDEVITGTLTNGVFTYDLSEHDPGPVTVVVSAPGLPESELAVVIEEPESDTENPGEETEEESETPEEEENTEENEVPQTPQNPETPPIPGVVVLATSQAVPEARQLPETRTTSTTTVDGGSSVFETREEAMPDVAYVPEVPEPEVTLESSDLLASTERTPGNHNTLILGLSGIALISLFGFIYVRFIKP